MDMKNMSMEEVLNDQFNDELDAVLTYHEIIEKMNRERDILKNPDKHIETLRETQRQEAIHSLEIANMIMDLGYHEPKRVQELEDFFHKEKHAGRAE